MRGKYARRARGGAGATAEGVLPAWSGWRRWEMPTPRTLLLLLLGAVLLATLAAAAAPARKKYTSARNITLARLGS